MTLCSIVWIEYRNIMNEHSLLDRYTEYDGAGAGLFGGHCVNPHSSLRGGVKLKTNSTPGSYQIFHADMSGTLQTGSNFTSNRGDGF